MKINILWIKISLIVAAGFILYANTLYGEFQFDDKPYIVHNPNIHDLSNIEHILRFQKTRFLSQFSFALNYHFHQTDVFGYHLVNVIIHIINSLLVFWFFHLLFKLAPLPNHAHAKGISILAAFLFLAHPVQTQAVAYITQRFASMVAMFYLLSVCAYLSARMESLKNKKVFLYSVAVISALLAAITKETAFTLPLMIGMLELFFFRQKNAVLNSSVSRPYVVWMLLGASAFVIPLLFAFNVEHVFFRELVSSSHDGDVLTSSSYFLAQFKVFMIYLGVLFWPVNQNFDYDVAVPAHWGEPLFLSGILCAVLLLACAFIFRKKQVLIFVGILWFFVASLVESSIIPIPHVIFEHRLYLPSVGFFLASIVAFYSIIKNYKMFVILLSLAVLCLGVLTITRNQVWSTEVALWEDTIVKSPLKARPYGNLAAAYIGKKEYAKAEAVIQKAIALGKINVKLYCNLAEIYAAEGRTAEAKAYFQKGLALKPDYGPGLTSYALLLLREGERQNAKDILIRAAQLPRDNFKPAWLLARMFAEDAELKSAVEIYEQMIERYPKASIRVYFELASTYRLVGDVEKMRGTLKKGITIFDMDPGLMNMWELPIDKEVLK